MYLVKNRPEIFQPALLNSYRHYYFNDMNANILSQNELMIIADVKQQTKLIHWLNINNIAFKFTHKRKIFTTLEQLNKSFNVVAHSSIEFGSY